MRSQQKPGDILVPGADGDVQRAPAVAVGETHVGAVLHEQLDELEVPRAAALVQRRLTVRAVHVDVDGDVDHRARAAAAAVHRPGRRRGGRRTVNDGEAVEFAADRAALTGEVRLEQPAQAQRVAAADGVEEDLLVIAGVRRCR